MDSVIGYDTCLFSKKTHPLADCTASRPGMRATEQGCRGWGGSELWGVPLECVAVGRSLPRRRPPDNTRQAGSTASLCRSRESGLRGCGGPRAGLALAYAVSVTLTHEARDKLGCSPFMGCIQIGPNGLIHVYKWVLLKKMSSIAIFFEISEP